MRKPKILALVSGLVAVTLVSANLIWPKDDFPAKQPRGTTLFSVHQGESGSSISRALEQAKVIKRSGKFYALALKDKRALSIAPGTHKLTLHIPAKQALEELLDPTRLIGVVNVKEGSTLSDVIAALKSSGQISGVTSSPPASVNPPLMNKEHSLEGLLFPAQYSFAPRTSYAQALKTMTSKFSSTADALGLKSGYETYSPYQVLIIASIAQVEGDPTDYAKIARVVLNRIKIGMPLQLNSTVQYAANLRGQIALSEKSLSIQSPYNTYRNLGLPPTPISNPGAAAISAALHPASGDWLYFITVKPGDTRFTSSFQQFSTWNALFHKNLKAGAFN